MSESIESLIRVANDNLKSELEDIPTEIEKIYGSKDIKYIKEIDNLIDKNDDLNYSLKKNEKIKIVNKKI